MSNSGLPDRRNVLITGADTPVGERLARVLISDSRVDRILAICGGDADLYPLVDNPRVRAIHVDLVRSRRVRELLFGPARDEQIHVVVHLAMHRSPRARGSRAHAFNVEALRGIIALAERHPTTSAQNLTLLREATPGSGLAVQLIGRVCPYVELPRAAAQ